MISFVVPTYNEEKLIVETLERLKKLTGIAYEIIVADNKSEDKTVPLAEKHAHHVVKNHESMRTTIGATRNRGATLAKHQYLVFLDCGVVIPELHLFVATAITLFQKDPRTHGIGVNVRVLPEVATRADNFFFGALDMWFWFSNNVIKSGAGNGKLLMVRTEAFKKIGGFNEKLAAAEDVDLFKRLAKLGRTHFEKSLTVYHHGRRAHALGWPKLLTLWMMNGISVLLFKRAVSKEWKSVR